MFCIVVNFQFEWHLRSQSTKAKVRHSTTLGYICRLQSIPMVSCMLLFLKSQIVQTSRFSTVRVLIDTCGMSYIKRFWKNVVCNYNFVICTVKCTQTCALGTGFKLVYIHILFEGYFSNVTPFF
jgi:hypothetical protein